MEKISFILPIKKNAYAGASDYTRAKLVLLRSLAKFVNRDIIQDFFVIVPSAEVEEADRELSNYKTSLNLSIVNEESLLGRFPEWRQHIQLMKWLKPFHYLDKKLNRGKLFRALNFASWLYTHGWYRNIIIKLFSGVLVQTKYYMYLDADLCLTRPVDESILFPNGKAIYKTEPLHCHLSWWQESAKVLGIPLSLQPSDQGMSVTPQIISKQIILELIEYLKKNLRFGRGHFGLFETLCSRGWTEYTLYWLFLLKAHKVEEFYSSNKSIRIDHDAHNVWMKEQAPDMVSLKQRVDKAFRDPTGLFLILQSSGTDLMDVNNAVRPYLD